MAGWGEGPTICVCEQREEADVVGERKGEYINGTFINLVVLDTFMKFPSLSFRTELSLLTSNFVLSRPCIR